MSVPTAMARQYLDAQDERRIGVQVLGNRELRLRRYNTEEEIATNIIDQLGETARVS